MFGPLSISELKADRFKRNTTGYLPSVQLAFLDEVFKASSSILNSLLTILNERIYHNGAQVQNVPLQALIAASNELPTENIELNALYDRFLVRHFVDYVSDANLHRLFDLSSNQSTPLSGLNNSTTPLSTELLNDLFKLSRTVTLPPDIQTIIQAIWLEHKTLFKEDDREQLSDRRLKKVLGLLQVSAASNARSKIDLSDVFLLKHCLWNHPDNIQAVSKLVLKHLQRATAGSNPVPAAKAKKATQSTVANANQPVKKAHYAYGLEGSGTEDDPFIIANAADFKKLNDPNVGEYGFYFKQVADIETTTTIQIFTGTYDGGGYKFVINAESKDTNRGGMWGMGALSFIENRGKMFKTLNTATIKNLCIYTKEGLADTVENNSLIVNCGIYCAVHQKYIITNLNNSIVKYCYCYIYEFQINRTNNHTIHSSDKGVIENCFIQRIYNSELVYSSSNTTYINNITNISDSNDPNSPNGQHIKFSADFFDRCKTQLKWDFDKVWDWNNEENQPFLREQTYQIEAADNDTDIATHLNEPTTTLDTLTKQLKDNIWLSN
ncbi:MAG: hypothetical protein RI956_61 [Pseudomonadota bacterium]